VEAGCDEATTNSTSPRIGRHSYAREPLCLATAIRAFVPTYYRTGCGHDVAKLAHCMKGFLGFMSRGLAYVARRVWLAREAV